MKKFFIVANIWKFIEAILLIAIGVTTIVLARNADFKWVIGLVAAICIIIDGAFNLIYYFFRVMYHEGRHGLIVSIAEITLGIFIIIVSCSGSKTFVVDNFTLLVSILLIVVGAALVLEAIAKTIGRGDSILSLALEFLLGIVGVTLGVLALIYSGRAADILLIIIGVIFIVVGLLIVMIVLLAMNKAHKAGKTMKEFFQSDFSTKDVLKK